MLNFLLSYITFEVVIVLVAILATLWVRHRRKTKKSGAPPRGFVPTDEVFIDPTTGVTERVWFNPTTGERFYERNTQETPQKPY